MISLLCLRLSFSRLSSAAPRALTSQGYSSNLKTRYVYTYLMICSHTQNICGAPWRYHILQRIPVLPPQVKSLAVTCMVKTPEHLLVTCSLDLPGRRPENSPTSIPHPPRTSCLLLLLLLSTLCSSSYGIGEYPHTLVRRGECV